MEERKAIKITDIEQMVRLTDSVLITAMYDIMSYDCNGVFLPDDDIERRTEQFDKDHLDGTDILILKILRDEYGFYDALFISAKKIVEKLEPIRKRILSMFRNGMEELCGYIYYADASVDDEWLLTLFAIRIRDKMLEIADKRETDKLKEKTKRKD